MLQIQLQEMQVLNYFVDHLVCKASTNGYSKLVPASH